MKLTKLPPKYEPGFLRRIDKRTDLFDQLSTVYQRIIDDVGGEESLTQTKLVLIEKYVFLKVYMQNWEIRMLEDPEGSDELAGRWIQATNALNGLAKVIGLEPDEKKRTIDVKAYVKGKA